MYAFTYVCRHVYVCVCVCVSVCVFVCACVMCAKGGHARGEDKLFATCRCTYQVFKSAITQIYSSQSMGSICTVYTKEEEASFVGCMPTKPVMDETLH